MSEQFKPFQRVLMRDEPSETWKATLFSFYTGEKDFPYAGVGYDWRKYCIPYEGNEQFCNTTYDPAPSEQEFQFGDKVKVWDKYKGGVEKDALFICKRRGRYHVLLPNDQIATFTACRRTTCSCAPE